jgi:hypothetical protein
VATGVHGRGALDTTFTCGPPGVFLSERPPTAKSLAKPLTLPRANWLGELRSRDMHLLVLEVKNVSSTFHWEKRPFPFISDVLRLIAFWTPFSRLQKIICIVLEPAKGILIAKTP